MDWSAYNNLYSCVHVNSIHRPYSLLSDLKSYFELYNLFIAHFLLESIKEKSGVLAKAYSPTPGQVILQTP